RAEIFRVVTLLMGLRKLSRSGCTQLFWNLVLLMGRKGRKQFKEAILSQTKVINFVQKDIGQMFPKWEFDVEDKPAENIIELMFGKKPPWYKAHKEAPAEASEEAAAEASEEDIKYLSERVEAVEKKVCITTKRKGTSSQNITSPPKPTLESWVKHVCFVYSVWILYIESVNETNAGRKSLEEDKGPDKEDARYQEKRDAAFALCRAKSDQTRKLDVSQQSPYTTNSTARVIIPNKKLYPGYNPFAPIDKKKFKELADWLKTFIIEHLSIKNHVKVELVAGGLFVYELLHIDAWINVLRKRYDANPQHFRSERMCFLDHLFAQQWRFNFKDFKDSELDQNGTIPSFCQSNKRHIVVFDSICSSISPEKLDVFSKQDFAKANGKTMRDKMAVDIFQELPDAHEFENKDNDANLGAYEGRLTVKSSGMLEDLTISSLESLLSSDFL
ncbi:unnamed protein product, partial [Brassica napus]